MKAPEPVSKRTLHGYGAVPQPIDNDKDTEPNLFAAPESETATAPRCYMCGRSAWAYDDGFEAGIAYALNQVHSLLWQGHGGQKLEFDEAATLVQWMRSRIQPNKP